MKGNKIFWIVLAVVILAALLWVSIPEIKKLKDKATGGGGTGTGNTGTSGSAATVKVDEYKTLYKGVKGIEVKELQTLLNAVQPSGALTVDGIFGTLTETKLYSLTGQKQITLSKARTMYATYSNKSNSGTVSNTTTTDSSSDSAWTSFLKFLRVSPQYY